MCFNPDPRGNSGYRPARLKIPMAIPKFAFPFYGRTESWIVFRFRNMLPRQTLETILFSRCLIIIKIKHLCSAKNPYTDAEFDRFSLNEKAVT